MHFVFVMILQIQWVRLQSLDYKSLSPFLETTDNLLFDVVQFLHLRISKCSFYKLTITEQQKPKHHLPIICNSFRTTAMWNLCAKLLLQASIILLNLSLIKSIQVTANMDDLNRPCMTVLWRKAIEWQRYALFCSSYSECFSSFGLQTDYRACPMIYDLMCFKLSWIN